MHKVEEKNVAELANMATIARPKAASRLQSRKEGVVFQKKTTLVRNEHRGCTWWSWSKSMTAISLNMCGVTCGVS